MANLTFSDLENEVYAQTGLDSTDSANQTNVDRWLNYVQQDICARWPWTFMESRETVVTIPDYITGTVSVNNGSTTVTGVGTTFTAGMDGYFIQFLGANDWYKILTFTSPTQINITPAFVGTSFTNQTFIIRNMFYQLSTAADRIIDIRNWNTPLKLIQVDPRTLDDLRPNPESTNSSYGYITWGLDAAGSIQISPYPFPSDARLFDIRTLIRPTDGAVSIPNKYAHVIAWGAISVGFAYLRKFDMAEVWNAKFEQRIAQMKSEYRMSEDYQPILRSIDSVQRAKWIQLPEQYPVITSG